MAVANDLGALLREIFAAAVAAADPQAFTRSALDESFPAGTRPAGRHWIIAVGKAAPSMALGAVAWCEARGIAIAGGIVVGTHDAPPPHPRIESLAGDHPIPGARSARTAGRIGELCEAVRDDDTVLALISGGASALIGAPVGGITLEEFGALNALLLGSGLGVSHMNLVRKRFSRWGAGRLAAALAPATVQPVLLSDVPGDDAAAIGSGPCAPDKSTAAQVDALLRGSSLTGRVAPSIMAQLEAVRAGALPETPKPGSPVFARVRAALVGGNHSALEGAASAATARGLSPVVVAREPLTGDAAHAAHAIVRAALAAAPGSCRILGGETTVTLSTAHGAGGRNQQLALAAARLLSEAGDSAPRITLLAAGTDGRDGPTDAAGAIVTNETWELIGAAGLDPAAQLARFDAYPALTAVHATLVTGPTGTNVADVVVVLTTKR